MKAFAFFVFLCFCTNSYADEVIWKGQINSDGTPTAAIPLVLSESYQIKVSNFINLGKWNKAGDKLANDACFEFGQKEGKLAKVDTLQNSQSISVCDGTYRPDHNYQSEVFVAKQNRIIFWVYDTDYDDNNGSLNVEIIHKQK